MRGAAPRRACNNSIQRACTERDKLTRRCGREHILVRAVQSQANSFMSGQERPRIRSCEQQRATRSRSRGSAKFIADQQAPWACRALTDRKRGLQSTAAVQRELEAAIASPARSSSTATRLFELDCPDRMATRFESTRVLHRRRPVKERNASE